MINNKLLTGTLALVLIMGFSIPAFADSESGAIPANQIGPSSARPSVAVAPDGTWYEFIWLSPVGSLSFGCLPTDPTSPFGCIPSTGTPTVFAGTTPWTFSCGAGSCTLTVTDAFNQGDEFEVLDNAATIGFTSVVPNTNIQCGPNATDPEDCLVDPNSSHGQFCLDQGDHSITIKSADVALNAGAAYFKIQQDTNCKRVGGELLPIDTTALFVSGLYSSAMWLAPIGAGIAGTGYYLIQRLYK